MSVRGSTGPLGIAAIKLSDGSMASIQSDPYFPGCQVLMVDGTPQSQVDLDDPTALNFEYVRRIGNVVDIIAEPGAPITAVHLGAGALTLPRYIAATRPESKQQVIELEPKLVDLVREHLPLPRNAQIRFRYGDARAVSAKLPAGLQGSADIVISDIFAGAETPAQVTGVEYYETLKGLIKPSGAVLVNVADGSGLHFARASAATLQSVFPHLLVLSDSSMLKGNRVGNLVFVAGLREFHHNALRMLHQAGPHPAKVMSGEELRRFSNSGQIIRDNTPFRGNKNLTSDFFSER